MPARIAEDDAFSTATFNAERRGDIFAPLPACLDHSRRHVTTPRAADDMLCCAASRQTLLLSFALQA